MTVSYKYMKGKHKRKGDFFYPQKSALAQEQKDIKLAMNRLVKKL